MLAPGPLCILSCPYPLHTRDCDALTEFVDHLQHPQEPVLGLDGHCEQAARPVPGAAVDVSVEARVRVGVQHVHGLAEPGAVAGNAALGREPDLVPLAEHRRAVDGLTEMDGEEGGEPFSEELL